MASTTPATVILSGPSDWEQWYEETMATVPSPMYKYFEPDTVAVLVEPVALIRPVDEPTPKGAETPQARKARLERNLRQQDIFYKEYDVYRYEKTDWDEFHRVDAKLRERIRTTVAPHKKAALRMVYTVRKWLTDLQAWTALPLENRRQNLVFQYEKLMGEAHGGWPSGGPTIWLAKWEELINQAKRYDEPLRTWLRDVCLVWEQVPDLTVYSSQVQISLERGDTAQYTPAKISLQIHCRWEHRKQGLALRAINRPKATRSAFTATEATFDGEEPPEAEDATATAGEATAKKGKQRKWTKKPNTDRSRSRSPASDDRTAAKRDRNDKKQSYGPC